MLKGIPPVLGPDLLATLRAMGHGDEIVIVDANFPATFLGPTTHRAEAISATDMLDAVLTLMPLDDFVDIAALGMAVVDDPDARPPVFAEFETIIAHHEPQARFATLERFGYEIEEAHANDPIESLDQERLDMLLRYLAT